MTTYSEYLALAKRHEQYSSFTALQDEAFHADFISDPARDLFIIGETSSGKTLIPLLIYETMLIEAIQTDVSYPKMLFIVPYRALAAQKKSELENYYSSYGLKIVQSTGEFRQNDRSIQAGDVDVAVMITEKAFRFQAYSSDFLSKYDLLVLDEVGLVNDEMRGSFYDFLFVWGCGAHSRIGRPRIVALGTPFYNWDTYIHAFGLSRVATEARRPVILENNMIVYTNKGSRSGILKQEGTCSFLRPVRTITATQYKKMADENGRALFACAALEMSCPADTPCRADPSLSCAKIGGTCVSPVLVLPEQMNTYKYILYEICLHHLLRGHQILIFVNNRAEVVELSMFLYQNLYRLPQLAGVFPVPPPLEKCREEVLTACGLNQDDVYGILEFDDGTKINAEYYRALWSGVAFHSAALPNEMRTYVEERLLSGREMKIVCSTETLAFGVNSTVDVVVVAKLDKQDGVNQMISMNEYKNYSGRAGRLRPGENPNQMKGTVYTLVRETQEEKWKGLLKQPPERLVSVFYNDIDEKLPLFLLNLMPDKSGSGVDSRQLLELARMMPTDDSMDAQVLQGSVKKAIKFLVAYGLVEKIENIGSGRSRQGGTAYLLTELGRSMRGYILNKSDFETLWDSVDEYVVGIYSAPDHVTFLYRLLRTKHATSTLNSIYEGSQTKFSYEELCRNIRDKLPEPDLRSDWMCKNNQKLLFVLGAVLAWCEGESAKSIYRNYGMNYALLSRLTEQLSYLVEIGMKIIPNAVDRRWREKNEMWQAWTNQDEFPGFDRESVDRQCERIVAGAEKLAVSLYFGINSTVHQEFLEYLEGMQEAQPLLTRYALHAFDPQTAQEFRNIVFAYSFFSQTLPKAWNSTEEKNNYFSLRRQHYLEIGKIRQPLVSRFFNKKFGAAFTGAMDWRN